MHSPRISSSLFWGTGTTIVCLLAGLPILAVVFLSFGDTEGIWGHLAATVLPVYIQTTLMLMFGVGLFTALLGVSTAWLISMYRFPGSRWLDWALLLPLAMPSYLIAFVYTDMLEYAGPVQNLLRDIFNWNSRKDYWFPEIRSLGGAVAVMTLTLYPYVYLLARAAFIEQCSNILEAGLTLGKSPWKIFYNVALPLSRPAIAVGISLVLMETINDFGTVDFFVVKTFTIGIFDVWLNMNSVAGAAQMALVLLLLVIGLIAMERWGRGRKGFRQTTGGYRPLSGIHLSGRAAGAAVTACVAPILFGFLIPAGILFNYAMDHYRETLQADFISCLVNSLLLSAGAALIALIIGLYLAYGARTSGSVILRYATRAAAVGYAIPGAVLAVGIMVPFGAFDNMLDGLMRNHFSISTGLLLSGTVTAVMFGYVVRFLALSYGTAEAGLSKVSTSIEGAAKTLGCSPLSSLRRIHFPLIRSSLLAAMLLVFVDCMKELPMTIILRPFNFDTLATYVYQYASDELLEEASPAALTVVATGIIPIIILSLGIRHGRPYQAKE